MRIAPLGDSAVIVTVGDRVDERTHRRVRTMYERLRRAPVPGQLACVPAFASVVVHYDPAQVPVAVPDAIPYDVVAAAIESAGRHLRTDGRAPPRVFEIPVCYGGEPGPDLEEVARAHAMTPEDVVAEHARGEYLVYTVGFLPGFPYLGGLSDRLATPRRATPRTLVPAGSVGIGGSQTGIYSMESPGGWNIIGRTPMALFTPDHEPPTLLHAGDIVRFRAISADEYERMRGRAR